MKEELHLFIIWENARNKEKEIIEDMNKTFKIIKVFEVEWNKEEFSNNLSRFYGTNLPKGSGKEQHCGNGKFLLIVVKDTNPIYENRLTSKGEKSVNTNMFDKKTYYRQLTGGGHKIHGTDNQNETNHDLTLLIGKNVKDFLEENKQENWDEQITEISTDLLGAQKWNTTSEMFYALNNCTNYAILRNYESLPEEIYENDHNDIDVICESLEDIAYVLNAKPVFEEEYRVHYKTQVEDKIAYFDLRHIGDKYYCEQMEKDILRDRIYNEKGFYTLNTENYFYTLIYHALIHKPVFKDDYKEKLMNMKIEKTDMNTTVEEYSNILKKWMIAKKYLIEEPIDKSVLFNPENAEYFKPLIYKGKDQIDILLATYNGKKYLKEQIDSILNQTHTNIHLIISDDCSKDGTKEILKQYEKNDERVEVYFQEKNLGYVKNFEFLLSKVENEIYMLSDQDDVWLPEKVANTYNKLKETDSDLVFTDLEVVDENLKTLYPSFNDYMKLTRKIKKYKNDYKLQYLYNCVTGCTLMSKKKFIDLILPIPTQSKYAIHDTWIATTVVNNGKVEYLDEKTIKYRQHGNNQVGTEKISHGFKSLEQVRELFLDVKLGLFRTYVENDRIFNEKLQKENREALEYFELIKNKKYFNFRKWNIFHKLYKNETFSYYIINFCIMNLPGITSIPFKIRYILLKLWRKL